MALGGAALGPAGLFSRTLSRTGAAATRNIRMTVVVSLVLICGSFASAAAIQLRLDRGRALDLAGQFETRRAQDIAADLSTTLDHYAALGSAFVNATGSAEASAALSDAGGKALRNIVLLDQDGILLSQMKGAPDGLLPLSAGVLAAARSGRTVTATPDGRSMAILFPADDKIVAVQIDPDILMRPDSMDEALLATRSGRILDMGSRWRQPPPMAALAMGTGDTVAPRA